MSELILSSVLKIKQTHNALLVIAILNCMRKMILKSIKLMNQ